MKSKIMYIENKSSGHHGLAWIGFVEFSKSGQTVYFNNKALKKLKNTGIWGNHFDIETGEEYWVSGVKKNGQNRHQYGSGKIMIDKNSIEEYLKIVYFNNIDEKYFTIIEFIKTDKSRFNELENIEIEYRDNSRSASFLDNNHRKLILNI
ncbi:mannose-1-phosphate guanylyltransferase [Chryseobacterium sp. SIMBA_038]|uniref:mannose-1-phosphate guanylyltransferase n=1 Tax=Chryseobacterium sp. SIMBA_038 TaxID=3085780 RepID=UPI00397D66F7